MRSLRFTFCGTAVGDRGYRFRSSAYVRFSHATFRACAFHAGKVNTELGRDSPRHGRRFYSRFLGLWWQPCRLRRRHACLYRLFFLFRLRWRGLFLLFLFRLRRLRLFFLFCFVFLRLLFFRFFRFGLFLFFFLLFRLRRFLALTTDECDLVADVYLATFLDVNFGKRPILRRFPFHRRLVCLDFGEHFASRNLIALLFLPRDESALGHRVAQLGHLDFRHGIR